MIEKTKPFIDLGLNPEIVKPLDEQGYTEPTQIQQEAIPLILRGSDLLASYFRAYARISPSGRR